MYSFSLDDNNYHLEKNLIKLLFNEEALLLFSLQYVKTIQGIQAEVTIY